MVTKHTATLTPPSAVEPFDVEEALLKLSTTEKIQLLSGIDFWHTKSVPRLNIPSIRLSDGPNGVRGTRFFNGAPAACFPCGTGLAATWNMSLLKEAGELMGKEAVAKGVHVLLGPTVNMQRGPLGGRAFESFSEDPVLAGNCAAAVINGIQDNGVIATVKHFIANDQEHQRMSVDSLITHRALREIYLLPFQIVVKNSRPAAFMGAYNKVNGTHVSEDPIFLKDILRGEWGWEGMIMSDWYGTYSTTEAVHAGLDLEMPGPTRWRGDLLNHALMSNKISQDILDDRVREVLKLVRRAINNGVPENAFEGSRDSPETAQVLRKISGEAIVLLKNKGDVLPFKKTKVVAVMGPNAKTATFCGGGSAALVPYYAITPFDGISTQAVDTKYSVGCHSHKMLPLMGPNLRTADGKVGVTFKAFTSPAQIEHRDPVDTLHVLDTYMYLVDYCHPKLTEDLYWAEIEAFYTPDEDGDFEFGLTVFGTGKLFLDDELLVDNETVQRNGGSFFNVGTVEETGIKTLKAGRTYKLIVDYASGVTSKLTNADGVVSFGGGGIRIGGARVINAEEEIAKAVQLAKSVDQVVLCVGLNQDWEQEGHDRLHMNLPGFTNELVFAVAAANPSVVVVVQSGSPVSMPWEPKVSSIVQAWYGGNETGNAIADVLFGDVNPSGKLPLSFPVRVEDNPTFLNYRSERGRVLYGEDVYIGYRFYETTKKETLFPFGHGLSYSTFKMANLEVSNEGKDVSVKLLLTNISYVDGADVVQVYVSQRNPSIRRPMKELKGYKKEILKAEASKTVEVTIETKYATSFWDEGKRKWISERDTYDVWVGTSSAETSLTGSFEVAQTVWWSGL